MTCSSLTPLYFLDIFDNFPWGPRDFGGMVFRLGMTLLLSWLACKTMTTSFDLLVKPGEDHALFKSHTYIFVGYF
jgi:hypothetical protein